MLHIMIRETEQSKGERDIIQLLLRSESLRPRGVRIHCYWLICSRGGGGGGGGVDYSNKIPPAKTDRSLWSIRARDFL